MRAEILTIGTELAPSGCRFAKLGLPMSPNHKKQAFAPEEALFHGLEAKVRERLGDFRFGK